MKNLLAQPIGFLLVLLSLGSLLRADNLMLNGGAFEAPAVKQRTPKEQGGDPASGGATSWKTLSIDATGGALTAGLTNEIAHTGKQSFYIKFDNVSMGYQNAALQTALLPVQPGSDYRIGLWGRVDKKNPLVLGDRPAYLKLQIEFFKADGITPAGEPEYRVQPIPGGKNRDPIFTADKWKEYYTKIISSEDAAFMTVKVSFETGSSPGKTNGILYIDDFSINGAPSDRKPTEKPAEASATPETAAPAEGAAPVSGTMQ